MSKTLATLAAAWCSAGSIARAEQEQHMAREAAGMLRGLTRTREHSLYKSVVLGSEAFNVTVFLPPASPDEISYYNATRFDWSSQIGNVCIGDHVLFADRFWRGFAHDPANPEAAVGLASEFGCGEFGALCPAGTLNYEAGSLNGLLGYQEAAVGEAFVKIGVGKLMKPEQDVYSPFFRYAFAEYPQWDVQVLGSRSIQMTQEISLNQRWGYRLQTIVKVLDSELRLETTLTNIGSEHFSTPHYSHNFLSADRSPIGPPWVLSMVPEVQSKIEPGVGSWSEPIGDYFASSGEAMTATDIVPEGIKIKAEFVGEQNRRAAAAWTAQYGDIVIHSNQQNSLEALYAYNVYVEQTTLSPEPIQMLSVAPGGSASWKRALTFELRAEGEI